MNILLLAFFTLVLGYLLLRAIYLIFFSPLSHIPGPWYAALGDVWNEWEQMTLGWSRTNHRLFEKYGPVVRIGAKKVIFLDDQAQKLVYGTSSKLAKDVYYKRFVTNNNDHAMTILDHAEWSYRRRATAAHYTTTNLALFEPEITKYSQQMLDGLNADGGKTEFDLMSVFRHLLVDIVFSTAFDMHNGTVEKWTKRETDPLDMAVTDFPKTTLLAGIFPAWFSSVLAMVPSARFQTFLKADIILSQAAKRVYDRFASDAEALKADAASQGRKSLIQRLMEYHMPDSGRNLRELEVLSESQAHLIAGAETTATTASYMIWELSQHPEILAKLRDELDEATPDHSVANVNTLFGLPYFNAFIKEGLRLYAVIPGPLPRVIPANMTDFSICGVKIPPGTCVSTQAWSLHRQPDVFPQPYDVNPDRWLEGNETERMRSAFIPFGVGPRICVGQNLAQIMLRMIISTVVRHFDIKPAKETTPETMRVWESFALFPAGLQAKFALVPREH